MSVDWYDYPHYFDLAFRDETRREVECLEAALNRYSRGKVRRMLEPACGSGRLIAAFCEHGFEMVGFDLNPAMIDYARKRIEKRGHTADLFVGDMVDFRLKKPVDAAFNTFNSFRHLLTEEAARRHLQCVAAALRPGGIFILGLHLLPPDASEESCERWIVRHGKLRLTVLLKVTSCDRRKRIEQLSVSYTAHRPTGKTTIRSQFPLRLYTARQMKSLLASVPELELLDVFDFWYELDEPLKLNDELGDTVLILRKRN